jgi:hypothetical protein
MWLKVRRRAHERKEPEFFNSSEVQSLIKSATMLRDRCMLSVAFERGLRKPIDSLSQQVLVIWY